MRNKIVNLYVSICIKNYFATSQYLDVLFFRQKCFVTLQKYVLVSDGSVYIPARNQPEKWFDCNLSEDFSPQYFCHWIFEVLQYLLGALHFKKIIKYGKKILGKKWGKNIRAQVALSPLPPAWYFQNLGTRIHH